MLIIFHCFLKVAAGALVGSVVDTEVTYAPSPRRLGKKKVKLNPVHSVIRGGANYSPESDFSAASRGYDKQPLVVPIVQNGSADKVTVIGGKKQLPKLTIDVNYVTIERENRAPKNLLKKAFLFLGIKSKLNAAPPPLPAFRRSPN